VSNNKQEWIGCDSEGLYHTHLSPHYRVHLWWAAYMQAFRMIIDAMTEQGDYSNVYVVSRDNHSKHTRRSLLHAMGVKTPCNCKSCAIDKARVIRHALSQAEHSMLDALRRKPGPGIQL
jgi:hypothetical protein